MGRRITSFTLHGELELISAKFTIIYQNGLSICDTVTPLCGESFKSNIKICLLKWDRISASKIPNRC